MRAIRFSGSTPRSLVPSRDPISVFAIPAPLSLRYEIGLCIQVDAVSLQGLPCPEDEHRLEA